MAVAAVVPFIENHRDIAEDLLRVIRDQHPVPDGAGRNTQTHVPLLRIGGLGSFVRLRRECTSKNEQTKPYQECRAPPMCGVGALPARGLAVFSEWSYQARISNLISASRPCSGLQRLYL